MPAPKVTNLNEVDRKAERFSAIDIITEAVENKAFNEAPKLLIVAVDEKGDYQIDMMRSGLSDKDILVLCEMIKSIAVDNIHGSGK